MSLTGSTSGSSPSTGHPDLTHRRPRHKLTRSSAWFSSASSSRGPASTARTTPEPSLDPILRKSASEGCLTQYSPDASLHSPPLSLDASPYSPNASPYPSDASPTTKGDVYITVTPSSPDTGKPNLNAPLPSHNHSRFRNRHPHFRDDDSVDLEHSVDSEDDKGRPNIRYESSSDETDGTTASSRRREHIRRAARARNRGMQEFNYWYPYYPPVEAQQRYGMPPASGLGLPYSSATPYSFQPPPGPAPPLQPAMSYSDPAPMPLVPPAPLMPPFPPRDMTTFPPSSSRYAGTFGAPYDYYSNTTPLPPSSDNHAVHFASPSDLGFTSLYNSNFQDLRPPSPLKSRRRQRRPSSYDHAASASGLEPVEPGSAFSTGIPPLPTTPRTFNPPWAVFPLKVFRGSCHTIVVIKAHWDDEKLIRKLSGAYDDLRRWRKWFSLRDVR